MWSDPRALSPYYMSQRRVFLLHICFYSSHVPPWLPIQTSGTILRSPGGKEGRKEVHLVPLPSLPTYLTNTAGPTNALYIWMCNEHITHIDKGAEINFKAKDLISLTVWATATILSDPLSTESQKRANIYRAFPASKSLKLLIQTFYAELSKL